MEMDRKTDREIVMEEKSEAVRIVTIRSVAMFFTAVVTASVLGVCILGSVGIYQAYQEKTVSSTCPHCETPETENKMMDTDMEKEMKMRMEDGQVITQRFTYDYDSNILLIRVPGNYSGNSAATVALDYRTSLVFASVHEENVCIVFAWSEGLASAVEEFMGGAQNEDEIIDIASMEITNMYLVSDGVIPSEYFQQTTDVTLSALCAGEQIHWLKDRSEAARRRRWSIHISVSVLGVKVNVDISW